MANPTLAAGMVLQALDAPRPIKLMASNPVVAMAALLFAGIAAESQGDEELCNAIAAALAEHIETTNLVGLIKDARFRAALDG